MPKNPFQASIRNPFNGRPLYAIDANSRLDMVKNFDLDQCRYALQRNACGDINPPLQLAVVEGLHRRVRELVGQEAR